MSNCNRELRKKKKFKDHHWQDEKTLLQYQNQGLMSKCQSVTSTVT